MYRKLHGNMQHFCYYLLGFLVSYWRVTILLFIGHFRGDVLLTKYQQNYIKNKELVLPVGILKLMTKIVRDDTIMQQLFLCDISTPFGGCLVSFYCICLYTNGNHV